MEGYKKQNELKMCLQYNYYLVKHAASQSLCVYQLAISNIKSGVKRMKKWAAKEFALVHVSFSLRRQPHYLRPTLRQWWWWWWGRVADPSCVFGTLHPDFIHNTSPPALYFLSLSLSTGLHSLVFLCLVFPFEGRGREECYSYWLRKGKQTVSKDNDWSI